MQLQGLDHVLVLTFRTVGSLVCGGKFSEPAVPTNDSSHHFSIMRGPDAFVSRDSVSYGKEKPHPMFQ